MKKMSKNYLYNLIYQIFTVIIPIFLTPYISKTLGVVNVGIYGYVTSIVSIFTTIGLVGINTFGYREIAYCGEDVEKRSKVFITVMKLRVVLFLIIIALYLPFLFLEYKLFYIIMIFHIISMFFDISWLFIGVENLKVVSLRNILVKTLSTVLIFVFVKNETDLWIYFLINSFCNFIVTISIVPLIKKYVSFAKCSIDKNEFSIKKYFIASLKLFFPQIGLTLYLQVDKIMLKLIRGEEYVAFYDYSEKIIAIPLALITAMCTSFVPYLAKVYAKNDKNELCTAINKIMNFSLLISLPMCFGIIGIADNLINWYLDPSFQYIIITIYILAPTIIFNSILNVSGNQYFVVTNNIKTLTISYFTALFVDVILNAFLISHFADRGSALATNIGLIIACLIQLFVMKKDVKFNNLTEYLKYFISSIIMCVAILFISQYFVSNILNTFILIFIGLLVYAILLVIFRSSIIFEGFKIIKNKIKK